MKQHPVSALLPPMDPDEFKDLKASIKKTGLLDPIVVFDGMVLDGWHRYQACEQLGIEPSFVDFRAANFKDVVKARNLFRRHLTIAQRITVAEALASYLPGKTNSRGDLGHPSPEPNIPVTAELARCSERSVQRARKVRKHGSAELNRAVNSGKVGLHVAAKIADLPKAEQAKAIAAPKPSHPFGIAPPPPPHLKPVPVPDRPPDEDDDPEAWVNHEEDDMDCAEIAVSIVRQCYEANKAKWNTPPPPAPMTVVEAIVKALVGMRKE